MNGATLALRIRALVKAQVEYQTCDRRVSREHLQALADEVVDRELELGVALEEFLGGKAVA
jgi:hypothetical protein